MHRPTDIIDLSIDLVDAVYLLSKRQREVIVMSSLGMTQKEISIDLGISQPAVSQHIQSGLERLRDNAIYLYVG